MYFVPGLDYTEYWCDYAKRRWGVKVHRYQHFFIVELLRSGQFRQNPDRSIPCVQPADIEATARRASGLEWIGYGYKSVDSLERNAMLSTWPHGLDHKRKVFTPIKSWTDRDVRSYLSRRGIADPDILDGSRCTEVNLSPAGMAYMREHWPADYRRILQVFPYAAGQADRYVKPERKRRARTERAPEPQDPEHQAVAD